MDGLLLDNNRLNRCRKKQTRIDTYSRYRMVCCTFRLATRDWKWKSPPGRRPPQSCPSMHWVCLPTSLAGIRCQPKNYEEKKVESRWHSCQDRDGRKRKGMTRWINEKWTGSINQYIFRGMAPNITDFQSHFYIFFSDLVFFGVTEFVFIFRVCPRAQGAQESQEFSPWRYSCCSLSWHISKHIINKHC